MAPVGESLLVFSDVHLGSDLNDSGPKVPRSTAIDADLAAFLAHYRTVAPVGKRWRVVVAGDFIDFVGMAIDPAPSDVLATEPNDAERRFGLGGAEDHVRLKLKRAAERHWPVFVELGRFVADGHALSVIHGNHDLELHWDSVKRDFCEMLLRASREERASGATDSLSAAERADFAARIDFSPWFFHREGLVFIEHGHQYDPFCATPFIMVPLCPDDPTRVSPSLSDSLLRRIVRRTPGMKEYGHESRGLTSYISWGLALGARGAAALFQRFFGVVFELRRRALAYGAEGGHEIAAEQRRRLDALSRSSQLTSSRLQAALDLHVAPIGRTPEGVLSSVMLDRLAVICVVAVLVGFGLYFRHQLGWAAIPAAGALVIVWAIFHDLFSRGRPDVDPATVMLDRARQLERLFSPSFVVMGHTHVPATKAVGNATYVNLGSWAEEEPDPEADLAKVYRAARTHLVIHERAGRHEAHLCEWQTGKGPRELEAFVRQPVSAATPSARVDVAVAAEN